MESPLDQGPKISIDCVTLSKSYKALYAANLKDVIIPV